MPGQPHRVEVESVHWPTLLPSLRLFDTFKQAIHPAKLVLAYLFVLLMYAGGLVLDLVVGKQAAFQTLVTSEKRAFQNMVLRLLDLDFGLRPLITGHMNEGALGALWQMVAAIPAAILHTYPAFFWTYLVYAFALIALFGGAISRLAALHATRDLRISPVAGLRFAAGRYLWFVLAPLLPLLIMGVLVLVLMLAGLVLFNLPLLDIVGAALYGPMLLLGLLVALILIGFIVAVHVLYPAIAIEGADAFDAISRAYNYVVGRPIWFLLYVVLGLIYFAFAYLIVSLVIYGTLWCTGAAVNAGVFAEGAHGLTRFEAIARPGADGVAAWLLQAWSGLLLMLLPAFAISFYFCGATWIYLLLRRAGDGVEFDDVHLPAESAPHAAPQMATEAPSEGAAEAPPEASPAADAAPDTDPDA